MGTVPTLAGRPRRLFGLVLLGAILVAPLAWRRESVAPPSPYGPTPSPRQLDRQHVELYGFLHLGVNTFTDAEWGRGDEDERIFDPSEFDADEIVRIAAAARMQGLILTAKHHDGFCLWPSRLTDHSVARSPWRQGRGDVVREVADACRRHGLQFGIYLSPWDRNHPDYGLPGYVEFYRGQLRELLTGYGPLFEVWFDGANGGFGHYGGARERRLIDRATYYDWPAVWALVRELQPGACIFSDAGPDLRWVGNECGEAGEPSWATLDPTGFAPGVADEGRLNEGDRHGTRWLPAECDVSIRPGWFYHPAEADRVKTPEQLLDLYFASVGRGASLLLNVPPDRRGRITAPDEASLREFGNLLNRTFASDLARDATISASSTRGGSARFAARLVADGRRDTYWAADDSVAAPEVIVDFGRDVTFGVVGAREHTPLGQRVDSFAVDGWERGGWVELAAGTSIGNRRLLRFPPVTSRRLRLRIVGASACPAIAELAVYEQAPQAAIAPPPARR